MSGHTDGASTADQLRDLIRENQRLIAELRRRDEALAAVRELANAVEAEYEAADFDDAYSAGAFEVADRIHTVLAAHTEQAEEAR